MVDINAFASEVRATQNSEKEVYSGWLTKQGGNYKSWKKRWFSVRGYQMLYFKEKGDEKPLGVITLAYPLDKEGVLTREVVKLPDSQDTKQRPHSFLIKGKQSSQRTYMLCAESDEEVDKWIDVCIGVIYSPKGGGMFGCALQEQILKEGVGPTAIPKIVTVCIAHIREHGLDEPGLFRLSGRASIINQLRKQFDMAEIPDLTDGIEIHAVAGVLKRYLRELPEPLLTSSRFETVRGAADVYNQSETEGVVVLQQIVRDLPCANASLVRELCEFLMEVAAKCEINKMTTKNLAVVFAPAFMTSPEGASESVIFSSHSDIELVTRVIIENYKEVFKLMPEPDEDSWAPFKAKKNVVERSFNDFDLDEEDGPARTFSGDIFSPGSVEGTPKRTPLARAGENRRRSMSQPLDVRTQRSISDQPTPRKQASVTNMPRRSEPVLQRSSPTTSSLRAPARTRRGQTTTTSSTVEDEPKPPPRPAPMELEMAAARLANMSPAPNRKMAVAAPALITSNESSYSPLERELLRERQLRKALQVQMEVLRTRNAEMQQRLLQYEAADSKRNTMNKDDIHIASTSLSSSPSTRITLNSTRPQKPRNPFQDEHEDGADNDQSMA
eukprot:m.33019 g.33019  ORF g.33019 m.33019 type:complete len:612 (+) comp8478_c1_seq1:348-2183(+)